MKGTSKICRKRYGKIDLQFIRSLCFAGLICVLFFATTGFEHHLLGSIWAQNDEINGRLQWLSSNSAGLIHKHSDWYSPSEEELEDKSSEPANDFYLVFSYLPDRNDSQYPFGIAIDFRLHLYKDMGRGWKMSLSNAQQENKILLLEENLDAQISEVHEAQKLAEELASKFLYQYFLCLRAGHENCSASPSLQKAASSSSNQPLKKSLQGFSK